MASSKQLSESTRESQLMDFVFKLQNVPLKCESCQKSEPVSWKCTDCNLCICADCKTAHGLFPITKNHQLLSKENVSEEIKKGIQETIKVIQSQKDNLSGRLQEEGKFRDKLENFKKKIISSINEHRNNLKTEIDTEHDEHVKTADQLVDQKLSEVSKREEDISSCLKLECDSVIKLLQNLESTANFKNLIEYRKTIESEINTEPDYMKQRMNNKQMLMMPNVVVKPPVPWDSSLSTKIIIEEETTDKQDKQSHTTLVLPGNAALEPDIPQIQPRMQLEENRTINTDYEQLFKGSCYYQKTNSVAIHTNGISLVQRMHMFGNKIWILANGSLLIFDNNCTLVNCITGNWPFTSANSVVQCKDGQMIVAGKNLYVLNAEGWYKETISKASYTDVVIHDNLVYALRKRETSRFLSSHSNIYADVFQYLEKHWISLTTMDIQIKEDHYPINLFVMEKMVYFQTMVGGRAHNKGQFHKFVKFDCRNDVNKKFFPDQCKSFGEINAGGPGNVVSPKLCGVDLKGNMLIADKDTNMIQVLNDNDTIWNVLKLRVVSPSHVVVEDNCEHVWVVTEDGQLVKFARRL